MMVKKGQVLCVLLGITLAAAVFFVDTLDSSGVSEGRIARNSYGQGEKSEEKGLQCKGAGSQRKQRKKGKICEAAQQ